MSRCVVGNDGHRSRLRERFLRAGSAGMSDHELLELLLCYAIARKDVKPLAKNLLHRFGSLEAVFAAQPEKLMQVDGIGKSSAVLIKLIMSIALELMSKPMREGIDLKNPEKLQKFLMFNCFNASGEVCDLLLLDHNCRLLETISFSGKNQSVFLSPDDLKFQISLCRGVRQVIMVHNHPGGTLQPSKSDIAATIAVKNILNGMRISLIDHFIVTCNGCVSVMKTSGTQEE